MAMWQELWTWPLSSKKAIKHECNFGFQLTWLHQHRRLRTFPIKPLRFVSVSYSKFDDSSLVMTIPGKFSSVSRRPRMSWHNLFSSFVTIFAQVFRVSKLPVIPESDAVHTQLTCDQSNSHFVLLDESLSLQGSLVTSLRPSLNLLCYAKTQEYETVLSPYTWCNSLGSSGGAFQNGRETPGWSCAHRLTA